MSADLKWEATADDVTWLDWVIWSGWGFTFVFGFFAGVAAISCAIGFAVGRML